MKNISPNPARNFLFNITTTPHIHNRLKPCTKQYYLLLNSYSSLIQLLLNTYKSKS